MRVVSQALMTDYLTGGGQYLTTGHIDPTTLALDTVVGGGSAGMMMTGGAGMAATLVRISDSKTLFSHVQSLSFSDGSNHKSKTCRLFGKPKFSSADIGKTKRQLRN